VRWVSHRARTTVDEDGVTTGLIGSIQDVTALISAQEQNARLAGIIESTADMVAIFDADTTQLAYMNRSAREVFGLVDADLASFDTTALYPPETRGTYLETIVPVLRQDESWSGELPMRQLGWAGDPGVADDHADTAGRRHPPPDLDRRP